MNRGLPYAPCCARKIKKKNAKQKYPPEGIAGEKES